MISNFIPYLSLSYQCNPVYLYIYIYTHTHRERGIGSFGREFTCTLGPRVTRAHLALTRAHPQLLTRLGKCTYPLGHIHIYDIADFPLMPLRTRLKVQWMMTVQDWQKKNVRLPGDPKGQGRRGIFSHSKI